MSAFFPLFKWVLSPHALIRTRTHITFYFHSWNSNSNNSDIFYEKKNCQVSVVSLNYGLSIMSRECNFVWTRHTESLLLFKFCNMLVEICYCQRRVHWACTQVLLQLNTTQACNWKRNQIIKMLAGNSISCVMIWQSVYLWQVTSLQRLIWREICSKVISCIPNRTLKATHGDIHVKTTTFFISMHFLLSSKLRVLNLNLFFGQSGCRISC